MQLRDRATCCAAAAALFAFAGGAAAQSAPAAPAAPAPPADERRIVVTGQAEPPSEQEITAQANNISIVGDPLHNPLPRFEDHLCPGVLGLKAEGAAFVIQRIRFTAEQLDLRMAEDGACEPNLIVAFVEGAQEQLAMLADKRGYMFAGLSVSARGELLESTGGARVWLNTVTRTRDGMPVPTSRDAASTPERRGSTFGGTDGAGNAITSPYSVALPPVAAAQAAHSRIFFPTREDIVSVLVLFDRAEVSGKSLLQLADYATMRGLAATRETSGEPSADTILSLFDGEGPKPDRLTRFDRAYLTTLYEGMPNLPAASKLAAVSDEMEKVELASGE